MSSKITSKILLEDGNVELDNSVEFIRNYEEYANKVSKILGTRGGFALWQNIKHQEVVDHSSFIDIYHYGSSSDSVIIHTMGYKDKMVYNSSGKCFGSIDDFLNSYNIKWAKREDYEDAHREYLETYGMLNILLGILNVQYPEVHEVQETQEDSEERTYGLKTYMHYNYDGISLVFRNMAKTYGIQDDVERIDDITENIIYNMLLRPNIDKKNLALLYLYTNVIIHYCRGKKVRYLGMQIAEFASWIKRGIQRALTRSGRIMCLEDEYVKIFKKSDISNYYDAMEINQKEMSIIHYHIMDNMISINSTSVIRDVQMKVNNFIAKYA